MGGCAVCDRPFCKPYLVIEMEDKLPFDHEYKVSLSIGFPTGVRGSVSPKEAGWDEEGWNELSLDEQRSELDLLTENWATNYIEYGWDES